MVPKGGSTLGRVGLTYKLCSAKSTAKPLWPRCCWRLYSCLLLTKLIELLPCAADAQAAEAATAAAASQVN